VFNFVSNFIYCVGFICFFIKGGGAAPAHNRVNGKRGGCGGGIVVLFAKRIVNEGFIRSNGENAPSVGNAVYM